MSAAEARGYARVVLDVDSTLCGVEGIDWLAGLRGSDVGGKVTELTNQAMRGRIKLDAVYGERLSLVRPERHEVEMLANLYISSLAPGAARAIRRLRDAGRRVVLVSGGLREAILPVAQKLGLPDGDVHAVAIQFTADGDYEGYDTTSPLATALGKRDVVEALALPPRVLAVGDGATDLAIRPVVEAFAAYTGFVRRETVVTAADFVVDSFEKLTEIVLA